MALLDKSLSRGTAPARDALDVAEGLRLAVVVRSLGGGGGAERAMMNVAAALAARGNRVDLVVRRAQGQFLGEVPETVRLVDLRAPSVVKAPFALASYLREMRPDAMLVTGIYTDLAALLANKLAGTGTRVVISVQNHLSVQVRRSPSPFMKLVPALARSMFPLADALVAVSRGVGEDLARVLRVPGARIATIYNPIVSATLPARAREPAPHPWFNEENSSPVLLAVGKLKPQKDFSTLIRAFALLRRQYPVRLVILGEGPLRGDLTKLASRLGVAEDVDLAGFVANPFACMARAAVFVLSSAWEGLPSVLIEALACGCPVVSTDCPSGPAEILEEGRYGTLVRVGDHVALARAIDKALKEPRDSTRLLSRAADFSIDRAARDYAHVLSPASAENARAHASSSPVLAEHAVPRAAGHPQ